MCPSVTLSKRRRNDRKKQNKKDLLGKFSSCIVTLNSEYLSRIMNPYLARRRSPIKRIDPRWTNIIRRFRWSNQHPTPKQENTSHKRHAKERPQQREKKSKRSLTSYVDSPSSDHHHEHSDPIQTQSPSVSQTHSHSASHVSQENQVKQPHLPPS